MSNVSEWLRLLTKNERMSESLIFLSLSLILSFLCKKRAIRLENRLAKFPALVFDVSGRCQQIFKNKFLFLRSLWFFENENFAASATHAHLAKIADFLELSS